MSWDNDGISVPLSRKVSLSRPVGNASFNSFFHKLYVLGQRIRLEKVLLVGSKDFTLIGRPFLPRDQISVEATVVEKTLTHKKVNHWRQIKTNRQRKTQCKFEIAVG